MKRRLVEQGGSTMMVSLPIAWIKKFGLKKGDEVEVAEINNDLIVSTDNCFNNNKAVINLEGVSQWGVQHFIRSAYIYGYDDFTLTHSTEQRKFVENYIITNFQNLTFEKQSNKECTLKSIAENVYSELPMVMKRNFLLVLSMFELLLNGIKQKNMEELKDVLPMEGTNNQLTNFCERTLNKKRVSDQKKAVYMYLIVWTVEKIADLLKVISKYLLSVKKLKLSKDILTELDSINSLFRKVFELYCKFDKSKYDEVAGIFANAIENQALVFAKAKTKEDVVVFNLLFEIKTRTADIMTPIFVINNFD